MIPVPFYFDWQFWSAMMAAIALTLSQLPPVHVMFRRARLGCETFSRMHLTHKVGNPNAQWHLIIENTGGKPIRVKSISLTFTRAGGSTFELFAQSYLRTPEATEAVMFTPFRLKPGEEWAHVLTFFSLFGRDDEKEYRILESEIRSDILAQKEQAENKERMCEANTEAVRKILRFFERHFKWTAGEYDLELKVITDRPEANISRSYRFSLFESESKELHDYSDGYRYGAGVYWVTAAHSGLVVPLHENAR